MQQDNRDTADTFLSVPSLSRETDGKSEGAAGWGVIPSSTDLSILAVAFKAGVELSLLHTGWCVCVYVCVRVSMYLCV